MPQAAPLHRGPRTYQKTRRSPPGLSQAYGGRAGAGSACSRPVPAPSRPAWPPPSPQLTEGPVYAAPRGRAALPAPGRTHRPRRSPHPRPDSASARRPRAAPPRPPANTPACPAGGPAPPAQRSRICPAGGVWGRVRPHSPAAPRPPPPRPPPRPSPPSRVRTTGAAAARLSTARQPRPRPTSLRLSHWRRARLSALPAASTSSELAESAAAQRSARLKTRPQRRCPSWSAFIGWRGCRKCWVIGSLTEVAEVWAGTRCPRRVGGGQGAAGARREGPGRRWGCGGDRSFRCGRDPSGSAGFTQPGGPGSACAVGVARGPPRDGRAQ